MLEDWLTVELVSAVACFKSGVRLAFAPDGMERAN